MDIRWSSDVFTRSGFLKREGVDLSFVAFHVAYPLEEGPLFDGEDGRVQIPRHLASRVDPDFLFDVDLPAHLAADQHAVHADIGLDLGALADHQRAVAEDGALEIAIDPDRTIEHQLAGEFGALTQKGPDLFLFFFLFPQHGITPFGSLFQDDCRMNLRTLIFISRPTAVIRTTIDEPP